MRSLLLCSVLLFALPAVGAVHTQTADFRPTDFTTTGRNDYTLVLGNGMDVTDVPGNPQLPVQALAIELDGRCRVIDVRVRATAWKQLASGVTAFPSQRQVILSLDGAADGPTAPDPEVYASATPYPAEPATWTGTGHRHGRTVVDLLVCPVRYTGAERRLDYCPRFAVEVEYEPAGVDLPPAIPDFEYLVVTSTTLDTVFQRLADWKHKKGVPATVRTTDWVYANYTGRDNAERLRSYLQTLPDSGVKYVLLGGDVNVVPHRKAFAMTSEGHIRPDREDSLPADLYFADLDGTWDFDNDNSFGEVADSVDLYPDLSVGRAPVNGVAEAQNFVRKVLQYEKNPGLGYQDNVLFFAEVMWSNPYTDGGVHKDRLEARCFSSGYDVTKKYERLGNESPSSVMAAIRDGQNMMNHDGHGWIDVMSCGTGSLRNPDADTVTNADYGIIYSIGCWTTAYDLTSIGEKFLTNDNGGAVAFIGNSSYGWGSPGNPGFGYSDKFDDRFWYEIREGGCDRIGDALAVSKAYYAPFSRGENVYRWHQYQVNLMGCPEMPVWTAVPGTLVVAAPDTIGQYVGRVLVTVADGGGAPVEGALVCMRQQSDAGEVDASYGRAYTDAAGRAWVEFTPGNQSHDYDLTVTARDFLPYEAVVPLVAHQWLNFTGWTVDDSPGNGDGIADPGESVILPAGVRNDGAGETDPAELVLRSSDPHVTITDSLADVGRLASQESLYIADAFALDIGTGPEDGQILRFELVVRDAARELLATYHPVVLVGRPVLDMERYYLLSPPALPGETKELKVAVDNAGRGFGHATWAKLTALDANATVLDPESIMVGEVEPRTLVVPGDSFRVSIAGGCPVSALVPMELRLSCDGYVFADTFQLLVGYSGFHDDMEAGAAQWTHGGTSDGWHITTNRYYSGSHAWYCGDSTTHRYPNNVDCWLETDEFMVAENCSLKFWRWFSVPNYGVDGIYPVVVRGAVEDTLDFIGTGGALGGELDGIESDWYQETYDLSYVTVGETIKLKIVFKSDDEDRAEGFYIDDFEVTGGVPPVTFVQSVEPPAHSLFRMEQAPNPFSRLLRLGFAGCPAASVSGSVHDVTGRTVRTFSIPARQARATWHWDGRDAQGARLPAGTYFVLARSGDESRLGKVLLAR